MLIHENSTIIAKPTVKQLFSNERKNGFKCTYLLNRDDEMSIKLTACKHIVDWNTNTVDIPELYGWVDFKQYYNINANVLVSNSFIYSKQHYIDIALSLPFVFIKFLLICPCQHTYEIFLNRFDCSSPFKQIGIPRCSKRETMTFFSFRSINKFINLTNTKE